MNVIKFAKVGAAFAFLFATSVLQAQIVTQNGGVTSPEIPTLRESITYRDAEDYQSLQLNHQFIIGVTPTFELALTVPTILNQEVRFRNAVGAGDSKRLSGLGDVSLTFKKNLYQTDDVLESTRWAVLAKLQAPTGEDDRRDGGVRIPRRLQLGTGGWGLGAGTVFTVIRDRHRFSAETSYFHQTRHDGFQPGPELDFNLAYWYRLRPPKFQPGLREVEVRPVIELLTHYRFSSRSSAGRPRDDGWLISAAPGIQVYPKTNLLLEFNVQVPLYQNIDDPIGDRRWAATFAVKLLF